FATARITSGWHPRLRNELYGADDEFPWKGRLAADPNSNRGSPPAGVGDRRRFRLTTPRNRPGGRLLVAARYGWAPGRLGAGDPLRCGTHSGRPETTLSPD